MLQVQNLPLYSPHALSERQNRSLLIQFLLFEILDALKAMKAGKWEALKTSHPRFFPYDWALPVGHFNKIFEHSLLLKKSFSDHSKTVRNFEKILKEVLVSLSKSKLTNPKRLEAMLKKIYLALEPLIEACKENENLLFFLLKNAQMIDQLKEKGHLHSFILKMHPCGLESLGEKMCDKYHQRGFFFQIPEFKLLLTELPHV